jgi:phosphoenolpyruvate-protein kinase (PTS system EI component)
LLEVKKIVRDSNVGELTRFAKRVLKIRDIREVHTQVEQLNQR